MIYQCVLCRSLMTVQGKRVRQNSSTGVISEIPEVCTAGQQFCKITQSWNVFAFILWHCLFIYPEAGELPLCPCSPCDWMFILLMDKSVSFLRFNTSENYAKGLWLELKKKTKKQNLDDAICETFSLFDLDSLCRFLFFLFLLHEAAFCILFFCLQVTSFIAFEALPWVPRTKFLHH